KERSHGFWELLQDLVPPQSVRSAEIEQVVAIVEAPKFSGVQHHVGKSFAAYFGEQLLRRIDFFNPTGERMLLKRVGRQRCTIEIEGSGFADEEKVGVRRKIASDVHGCLVLVQCPTCKLTGRFLSKCDLFGGKNSGV